jgi:hypothetical protein
MNWQEVYVLLHVVEKSRDYPTLKNLHDRALGRLQELSDQPEQHERRAHG